MKIRIKHFYTVFFLSLALTASQGFSETPSKMDPALTIISQTGASPASTRAILKSLSPGQGPFVETLVKFQGSLSGAEALGGRVRSVIGDIATVDIPVSALSQASGLPEVIYIESSKRVKRRLDVSVPETGAASLRSGTPPNWTGSTGKGVVIGIIDTGIDLSHKDFKDSCGSTRILYLWDQAATSGTPPSGYGYGHECTKASIDACQCTETDTDGHGTHVAGIAAGNGSAGSTPYKYVGMAPGADIIVVNSLNSSVTTTTAVFDAINYIQSKAASLGEPSVINLSFGGHVDPHDGTSVFEQALDNASGAGKVLVCAAGNETQANIHASGNVATGGSATVSFSVPSAGGAPQTLDLWYQGPDRMSISLSNGTCSTPQVTPGSTQTFDTGCGKISISSSVNNPGNHDNEIFVTMDNGIKPLSPGSWSFTITGVSVSTQGRFDVWIDDTVTNNARFTDHIDQSITLDDCGTATKPISVGAYTTKNFWQSIDGGTYSLQQYDSIGSIGSFSSLGPRRSCSDPTLCPSVQKPDIAAPGEVIMSSYSAQSSSPNSFIDPDGAHAIEAGTSMSAPHVAGAVALLLEKSHTLAYDQVKSLLTSNARTDSYTGTTPNNKWGYGKLDASMAFNAAPGSLPSSSAQISCTSPISCSSSNSSSGGGGGGGCFVATAAYGSYLDPHVVVLREFRDRYLLTNGPGRAFVALYYRLSPPAADFIRGHEALRILTRFALAPLVYGIEYPGGALAVICLGAVVFIPLRSRIRRRKL